MDPRAALRYLRIAVAFGITYAAIAAGSLLLTQGMHSSAFPWPADAIVLALLCRVPLAQRHGPLLAIGIAMAAVTLAMSPLPWTVAMSFGAISMLEVGLGSWLITERLRIDFRQVTTIGAVRGFLLAGVLAPLPSSLLSGAVAASALGLPFLEAWLQRWRDAVLMFAIFAPPILFCSRRSLRRLWAPGHRWENLAHPLLTVVSTYLCFRYIPFPFVTLMVPLLVVAYRMGPLGASLCGLLAAVEIIVLWLMRDLPPLVGSIGDDPLASIPLMAIASMVLAPIALSLGVTERRAAMRALRVSERETAEIIEQSPTGMAVFPHMSDSGTLNDAFLRMLGRDSERGMAITAASFMDETELQLDMVAAQAILDGNLDFIQGRRQYRRRDGTYLTVQVRASLNRNPDGTPRRWLLQTENIDERLRAERLLQAERERLRVILESVGDGVLTIDRAGVITYANSAVLETLGQPAASVIGRELSLILTLTEIRSGQVVPSVLAMAEVCGEPVTRSEAVVLHTPGGDACYVRETVSPLQLEQGVISGWVIAIHDVTESHLLELETRKRADVDAVTNLANRHSFTARVEKVFERAQFLGLSACVLAIDLDHFKLVNDDGGHAAGDKMLKAVGEAIVGIVRGNDLVARIGGDEFAVVLDRCDGKTAIDIASRLVMAIRGMKIVHGGTEYSVGASVGVAETDTTLGSAAEWIAAADTACYRAKRAGRGQACAA